VTDAPLIFEEVPLRGPHGGSVTLSVPANQAVSLVGDAGSGVNELGAMALALTKPERGRILVYGEDLAAMPRRTVLAFRRRVGYVPAGDGLLQNLSLAENVALPLRFGSAMSTREINGRLRIMLAAVRLGAAAELRPAEADEEQRRRASLARALAFDPDLVILEQPFDGLGGRAVAELLEVARGGETAAGSRRSLFIVGQYLPSRLQPRVEMRHRIVRGELQTEA
jgi:ABC-type transporter Mla maintaining outer membrane lipid asymmetry ATPase subunit MlaF